MQGKKSIATRSVVIIVAALLVLFYFIFDPGSAVWMPKCLFHTITGYDCAGCGSQRLAHALLHLDIVGAWRANALLLCVSPFLIIWLFIELSPRRYRDHAHYSPKLERIHRALNSATTIYLIIAVLILWTIIRNCL